MFKIECDSPEALNGFFSQVVEAKVEAATAHANTDRKQQEVWDLRDEVGRLKDQNALLQSRANIPVPLANNGPLLSELIRNCRVGNKIACIKVIRQMTGMGLKESKDLFEEAYNTFGQVG